MSGAAARLLPRCPKPRRCHRANIISISPAIRRRMDRCRGLCHASTSTADEPGCSPGAAAPLLPGWRSRSPNSRQGFRKVLLAADGHEREVIVSMAIVGLLGLAYPELERG